MKRVPRATYEGLRRLYESLQNTLTQEEKEVFVALVPRCHLSGSTTKLSSFSPGRYLNSGSETVTRSHVYVLTHIFGYTAVVENKKFWPTFVEMFPEDAARFVASANSEGTRRPRAQIATCAEEEDGGTSGTQRMRTRSSTAKDENKADSADKVMTRIAPAVRGVWRGFPRTQGQPVQGQPVNAAASEELRESRLRAAFEHNTRLESENTELKAKVQRLEAEIEELKDSKSGRAQEEPKEPGEPEEYEFF